MEGIPALLLWDQISKTLTDQVQTSRVEAPSSSSSWEPEELFKRIDEVAATYPVSTGGMRLVISEDNEAVIN